MFIGPINKIESNTSSVNELLYMISYIMILRDTDYLLIFLVKVTDRSRIKKLCLMIEGGGVGTNVQEYPLMIEISRVF